MMNIDSIGIAISAKQSPFYMNEYLKTFMDAYIAFPDKVPDAKPFQLLHRYIFGEYSIEELKKYSSIEKEKKEAKHFDLFIGYRFLSRKFRPFFISISKLNYPANTFYEVTGFSTLMDDELDRPWYKTFIDLGVPEKFPVQVIDDEGGRAMKMKTMKESLRAFSDKTKDALSKRLR